MKKEHLPPVRVNSILKERVEKAAEQVEETLSDFIRKSVEQRLERIEKEQKKK
jgi:predicted transcriptional regulator